jgi:hypothetical protein
MKFVANSRNNRIFADSMMALLCGEIIRGCRINPDMLLASYAKYNAEFKHGKHGGYSMVRLGDKVSDKELERLNEIVRIGHERRFTSFAELQQFVMSELPCSNDYFCFDKSGWDFLEWKMQQNAVGNYEAGYYDWVDSRRDAACQMII